MNTKNKIILILLNTYVPGYKSGGPIQSILNTVNHLGDQFNFKIITSDRDATDRKPYENVELNKWVKVGKAEVYYLSGSKYDYIKLIKLIRKTNYDTMYLNSFFNFKFTIIPLFAKKIGLIRNKKTLLAPRGELSKGALSIKAKKKNTFIKIFKTIGLFKQLLWQVSSVFEKNEVIEVMNVDGRNIKVAPNLTSVIINNKNTPSSLKDSNTLKVVFLSRITPKKNLEYVLEILNELNFSIQLTIVGPVRDDFYWKSCLNKINSLPNNIKVNYLGSVPHTKVFEILRINDVFFFPTKGENYGHVILEAALAGIPLLISDTTPWLSLEQEGVGWSLPLDNKEVFKRKLKIIYQMSGEEHLKMRSRVKEWANSISNNVETIEKNKKLFL